MEPNSFDGDWSGQLVATAIHNGHDLRADVARLMVLDEADRFREEDPFTGRIAALAPARVVVNRSRFEADLNRVREKAIYRTPADAWGLDMWSVDPLPDDVVTESLALYDAFYAELATRLDELAARGPFVVYDVHSYNHRRAGSDQPEEPWEDNPEINLGTGSVDLERFGDVVAAFRGSLQDHGFDVRDNVKFKGQALAWWVHERYPGVGCVLAIEFKKTFMDEWTGIADDAAVERLAQALAGTIPHVLDALPR